MAKDASTVTYADINDDVLQALQPPSRRYYCVLAILAALMGWAGFAWAYQVQVGMGVTGLSIPVGWAVYITNFVFWVGIAHSGTLISAILHLVRSRWRDAVSRSAEAMTVFAVMTAGLFPLVHLGRLWVFYYILPYPSDRQLWPNFQSPLVWDVVAVTTYLTVSVIFFYVGLLPDLAAARDRARQKLGPRHLRTQAYRALALGWSGAASQWHHYDRAYLFFAALATPLVISVHSVVSWDFAMSLLPGWHETIFAPYFVAGAIHSGLAMVLTLLIPMRKLLHLERLMKIEHFEAAALTMLVTTAIVTYAYVVEPFIAWYSGDTFEWQFTAWRAGGWLAVFFWALVPLNILAPFLFIFKRVRRNLAWLFVISILVNLGMWLERFVIIVGSTAHDFLPHNWHAYAPRWPELSITVGAFAFFLFCFALFARLLPTVPGSEVKRQLAEQQIGDPDLSPPAGRSSAAGAARPSVRAVFSRPDDLIEAVRRIRQAGFDRIETFSPMKMPEVDELLNRRASPVRYWALAGGLCGAAGGFALAIGSALVNNLIVGGKPPVAIIPYCIIAFEGTVLLGTLFNLAGLIYHARLGRATLTPGYDERFSRDKFGLLVAADGGRMERAKELLSSARAEEIRVFD